MYFSHRELGFSLSRLITFTIETFTKFHDFYECRKTGVKDKRKAEVPACRWRNQELCLCFYAMPELKTAVTLFHPFRNTILNTCGKGHQFRLFATVEEICQRITKRLLPCSEGKMEAHRWLESLFVLCAESPKGIPHFKKGQVFHTPYNLSQRVRPIRNSSSPTKLGPFHQLHVPGFLPAFYLWSSQGMY